MKSNSGQEAGEARGRTLSCQSSGHRPKLPTRVRPRLGEQDRLALLDR